MRKTFINKAVLASFCLLITSSAMAGGYLGGFGGVSIGNNNTGTSGVFGGHVGFKIGSIFSLGAYGSYQSLGSSSASIAGISVGASSGMTILAVEPNFWLGDFFYFGGKAGLGLTSSTVSVGSVSATGSSASNFCYGPAAGIDLKLAPKFAIGAETNYILVSQTGSTLGLLNILGTITFMW